MATKVKLIADNVITTSQIDTSSLDSHFTGGTGVTYSSGTISIGQAVATTDNVTFADLTVTGDLNITGDINSYNVTDLDVTDQTITLGVGQIEANSGGSGIIVDGSGASILWDEPNDWWDYNKGIRLDGEGLKLSFRTSSTSSDGEIYTGDTFGSNRLIIAGDNGIHNVIDGNANGVGDWSVYNDNTSTHLLYVTGSNGHVGIGTSSPQQKLDVIGNLRLADASGVALKFEDIGSHNFTIQCENNVNSLNFKEGGSNTIMSLEGTNRRVGIGTTSPSANLDVKRDTNTANNIDSTGFDFAANIGNAGSNPGNHYSSGLRLYQGSGTIGSGLGVMYLGADNGTATVANQYTAQVRSPSGMTGGLHLSSDDSNGKIKFTVNGSERMRINSSGNVGIGTSSPSVISSSVRSLSLGGTSTTVSGGIVYQVNGTVKAYHYVDNDFLVHQCVSGVGQRFWGGASEAMRIDSSGNVGIGTSSPRVELNVQNGSNASSYTGAGPGDIIRASGSSQGNWIASEDDGAMAYFGIDSGEAKWAAYNYATSTEMSMILGQSRMYIKNNGDVGIGTTNPQERLHVEGSVLIDAYNMGAEEGIFFRQGFSSSNKYNLGIMTYAHNGSTNDGITIGAYNGFSVSTGSNTRNERFRISSTGAVSVVGSLSKGSGSFKIDHPLESKTDTHHLVHSFIEGPQADLIYRGKVDLVDGSATVNIDTVAGMTEGTFVALNREVQCFTSNESDWDAVKGSVSGNILTIECQNVSSTATVSWLVIGERQDPHMYDTEWTDEDGKVIVEPLKETAAVEE